MGRAILTGKVKASVGSGEAQVGLSPATYSEVGLTELTSLNGVSVPASMNAYIPGGTSKGIVTETGDSASTSWAKDGMFFGFVTQTEAAGPVLTALPLIGDEVIFTGTGCWNLAGLSSTQLNAPTLKLVAGRPASLSSTYPAVSLKGLTALTSS